ncbi:zinc finger CCCH domain-containing protein 18-like isoform X1 [Biomphalaria glabrata]|uniref:Zinc finger CCCH domain-containing protein 18-like isoform X1 n=1 Tax=Biomphalaria glabrata TaxID=6526 RepID=A0A9W3AV95_BIOGL|nr:zinc finger CCCH domain-containing protein 18-like isoform X1 [Biomphalaria glabrata]XP_055891237.1 zinc finger CCCH domain-containing protein 18-like isoform X1 [Biomphalaria glabrata]
MEAGGDHVKREDGGDSKQQENIHLPILSGELSHTVHTDENTTIISDINRPIIDPSNDTKKSVKTLNEDATQSVKELKEGHVELDNRALSPCSYSNSETSEREITLEPLSPNAEFSSSSVQQPLDDLSTSIPAGPSDDREDISDGELDIDSAENLEGDSNKNSDHVFQEATNEDVSLDTSCQAQPLVANDDTRGTLSSDDREIIDLKLEDAIGKSDEGADDINRRSKGPSEDLEAVSDDELLPETSQAPNDATAVSNTALMREEVSSEDEVSATNAQCDIDLPQELPNFSGGLIDQQTASFDQTDSFSHLSSENVNNLPVLEAEPISDEEDMEQEENVLGLDGDGEAGEIHSPPPIRSPVSESGGLLGEVEPISAEESSDTDGELPSGDEDSAQELIPGKSNNNFESIESDEDGNIDEFSQTHTLPKTGHRQKKNDYMETISDEEISESAPELSVSHQVSAQTLDASYHQTSPVIKDVEMEKKQVTTNFNEHQVELDYEENDGDEGESKIEEVPAEPKVIKEGAEEEGELEEVCGTDKDEGELSDDDCEEGEIKEPGSKKPFVKPMCRFFQRGNCTWGVNCRFLHPGVNDKGNYQMIEIPGFKPIGIRARIGIPGQWPEQPEEPIELPPPPIPDIPPVETAWERGLRIAKEQRKKANERKELEPDFEEKRLNLSVDEERELNKENERMPKIVAKDPYYDQQAFEEDEYYKISREPAWQTGHYENFEVRYHRENSFSPPYRDKPLMLPPARFTRPYSPPIDKFGRDRVERREPFRPDPIPSSTLPADYPSPLKRPDEWTDPWRRSKTPPALKPKIRSHSRGRRAHRSISDSSNSSRSSSGSSSGSSHSSRSLSGSSRSSRKWKQNISRVLTIAQKKKKRRSRSVEPAPPGVDRHDRYISPSREPPRSSVAVRGRGGYNSYDQNYYRSNRGYDRSRGSMGGGYHQRGYQQRGGNSNYYNNYNSGGGGYPDRDMRDRGRDDRMGRNRVRSPPDRPLPYVRPRPKSASSRSSSSRSRSRSRGRFISSHSRSSSGSSRSSSSSSSSAGSADSEHLYRDLGPPSKNSRVPALAKKKRTNSHKEHPKGLELLPQSVPQRGQPPIPHSPVSLDRIPHPRDPKPQPNSGRNDSKYASRNAPQVPVKAKDPLKVVGQKSNIKLTLLPKQQQQSLGNRPNPLDSPPHSNKRRMSDRDASPPPAPAPKRLTLPLPQTSALRIATEKAAKIQIHQDKAKSPPPASVPLPPPPSGNARSKLPNSPQKQPSSNKSRAAEPVVAKAVPKVPSASAPTATATGAKAKKSMSSRREELLKQLKAVEDAIARKKSKLQ